MNNLNMSILGFPAVNRDLNVEILDPVSNRVVREVKPFLDGTVHVTNIDPGSYEVRIKHPNLTLPVLTRPIRVLPAGDTRVSVLIDPSRFRDTPIADIPEANLTPVRQTMESVAETLLSAGNKQPGEAIKSADWNTLTSGVRDVALAMGELTRLVSPTGHDHPELLAKFEEVTTNFRTLLETLSSAMTELQRQIQSLRFRKVVEDVLDAAAVDKDSARGKEFLDLVGRLDLDVTKTPTEFARTARNVGVQLGTKLETLIDEKAGDASFTGSDPVKTLTSSVDLLRGQRTTTYDSELAHHRRIDRTLGGGATTILRR